MLVLRRHGKTQRQSKEFRDESRYCACQQCQKGAGLEYNLCVLARPVKRSSTGLRLHFQGGKGGKVGAIDEFRHTTDAQGAPNMQSVIENNDLTELLTMVSFLLWPLLGDHSCMNFLCCCCCHTRWDVRRHCTGDMNRQMELTVYHCSPAECVQHCQGAQTVTSTARLQWKQVVLLCRLILLERTSQLRSSKSLSSAVAVTRR